MATVEKRVHETDDHRFDTTDLERQCCVAHFLVVQWGLDLAVGWKHPFVDRDAVAPTHQRCTLPRNIEVQGKVERSLVPSNVQNVAKSLGRQHPDIRTIVLDGNIGRDRGAMNDLLDLISTNICLGAQFQDSAHHGDRLILHRRRDLMGENFPADRVLLGGLQNQVCVGAADIYANACHTLLLMPYRECLERSARCWFASWFFYVASSSMRCRSVRWLESGPLLRGILLQ